MFSTKNTNLITFDPDVAKYDKKLLKEIFEKSYAHCMDIMEEHSKSFFFASRFLPKDQRNSVASWYAFARLTDDIVDEGNLSNSEIEIQLNLLRDSITQLANGYISNNPILHAFGQTIRKHNIPLNYVYDLIEGVRMDLNKDRYENNTELELYCYRVASTIGLVMTHIFQDNPTKRTLARAVDLGLAMQLTNILRDVREDFERGRIYIPLKTMIQYNVSEEDLRQKLVSDNLKELIKHEIARTKGIYRVAELGIKDLPPAAQYTIFLASRIYGDILNQIKRNKYEILSRRAVVSKTRKILIAFKVRLAYIGLKKEKLPSNIIS
ncbi:MAG: phytoene/squalene synthase family protein [Candidatus Hodarchaeales archaeon]|jgi:phytoene synthase